MKPTLCLLVAALVIPASSAQTLTPGTRVRATASEARVVGTVALSQTDSLRLALAGGEAVSLAWSDLERVEQSLGQKGRPGRGALIGAGVMTALAIAAVLSGGDEGGEDWGSVIAVVSVPPAAALGAGVGALVGLAWRAERWVAVPISTGGGATGVRVAVSF